jgi:general secretion pathway protein H
MREAGFTLLELLVVLLVAGLLFALVPAVMPGDGGRAVVLRSASELASALKRTRGRAIAANGPAVFTLDPRNRAYEAASEPQAALPSHVDVTLRVARAEVMDDGAGRIQFFADGSSTGGRITLAAGASVSHVTVDWLTGRVSIER